MGGGLPVDHGLAAHWVSPYEVEKQRVAAAKAAENAVWVAALQAQEARHRAEHPEEYWAPSTPEWVAQNVGCIPFSICPSCGHKFFSTRSDAKACSSGCRVRMHRDRETIKRYGTE